MGVNDKRSRSIAANTPSIVAKINLGGRLIVDEENVGAAGAATDEKWLTLAGAILGKTEMQAECPLFGRGEGMLAGPVNITYQAVEGGGGHAGSDGVKAEG